MIPSFFPSILKWSLHCLFPIYFHFLLKLKNEEINQIFHSIIFFFFISTFIWNSWEINLSFSDFFYSKYIRVQKIKTKVNPTADPHFFMSSFKNVHDFANKKNYYYYYMKTNIINYFFFGHPILKKAEKSKQFFCRQCLDFGISKKISNSIYLR